MNPSGFPTFVGTNRQEPEEHTPGHVAKPWFIRKFNLGGGFDAYFIISQDVSHFQDVTSWQGPLTSWPVRMLGPKFGAQLWGLIWAPEGR